MKPNKFLAFATAAFALLITFGFIRIDDDPIKKIVAQLAKWTDVDPQEKVYLQMDKPYYASGEDIWFKAYITIGPKHQLSALSSIVNVELIDERDSVRQAIKLPVFSGTAWGDFALPDTLPGGNYRIRAYTNYMRNAGDEYFFDKTIQIGNSISNKIYTRADYHYSVQAGGQQKIDADIAFFDLNGKPYAGKDVSYHVLLDFRNTAHGKGVTDDKGVLHISFINAMPNMLKAGRIVTSIKYDSADPKKVSNQTVAIKAASNKVDVQFFPEGGTLVAGVRTHVGFKATNADGLGATISGVLVDNTGAQVARISTQHLGMGALAFTPEDGKTYKANIKLEDGSETSLALPVAASSGYVLNISNTDADNVFVRIANAGTPPDAVVSLVAHQNGAVLYAANSKPGAASFSASIPKNRFASGIVQFTLFNANAEPLAERLVFIQNNDLLNININTDKKTYAPREKVKIDLSTQADDKPSLANISAAVIDESKVPVDEDAESTILSTILLTSDLKGYIEKPNYYFNNVSDKTRADLDLLMMTQGYRRFVWKQILNDVFLPQVYKPETSLAISGTLHSGKKPVPNGKVTLFSTKGGVFILDTVADQNGHFAFNNLIFKDSIRFVIQARTEKNKKDVEIDLDNIAPQIVTKNKNAPDVQVSINNIMSNYLQNSKLRYNEELKYGVGNHVTMLKEVVVKEVKKPLQHSDNLNGAGNADQIIKSDDLSTCTTLDQCLQGRLLGVIFRGGVPYSTRSQSIPMQIVVDGMYMESDFLQNIVPSDVASIEVLRSISYTAIYGSNGAGGVLVINMKRGDEQTGFVRYSPGVVTYAPHGYYRAREFYAPRYDDPKTKTQMPDLRSTIFWKPSIVTDKDGKASFDYFNADGKGTYRVVVEGVDGDGRVGRQVYRYKVE